MQSSSQVLALHLKTYVVQPRSSEMRARPGEHDVRGMAEEVGMVWGVEVTHLQRG